MKPPVIVDLFAGPGGWSEALRASGCSEVGIEWDASACVTRAAAGHRTIRADVAMLPVPTWTRVEGLIASPPCQAFSNAGKRGGFDDIEHLFAHVHACQTGWRDIVPRDWSDPRAALVLEPLRWVDGLTPRWVALEQVPPVLPLWEAIGGVRCTRPSRHTRAARHRRCSARSCGRGCRWPTRSAGASTTVRA